MKKIGIVSCDEWINKIQEDIMLQKHLLNCGYNAEIISWQDDSINYMNYSHLILRSVWGYQNYYLQFKNWLAFLKEKQIPLYNDVDLVMNNIRKNIQFELLDKYNICHIPTQFVMQKKDLLKIFGFSGKIVIKPIISGSGKNTYIFNVDELKKDLDKLDSSFSTMFEEFDNGLMVQPFIDGIYQGEYSCIFIGGVNTHNMLRFPGIFTEKKRSVYLSSIPKEVENIANKVADIPEFKDYLYMRVDVVVDNDKVYIMEVEMAEPDLLIKYVDDNVIQEQILNTFVRKLERKL